MIFYGVTWTPRERSAVEPTLEVIVLAFSRHRGRVEPQCGQMHAEWVGETRGLSYDERLAPLPIFYFNQFIAYLFKLTGLMFLAH